MKFTGACVSFENYAYLRSSDARTDRVGVDPRDRACFVRRKEAPGAGAESRSEYERVPESARGI